MRTAKLCFLSFLAILVLGCASCVPGICGCALSIWPSAWEQFVDGPAFLSDLIGFIAAVVSAIVMLVLWTRRKTIHSANRPGLDRMD